MQASGSLLLTPFSTNAARLHGPPGQDPVRDRLQRHPRGRRGNGGGGRY